MKIKKGDKLPGSELFYLDQNNDVKKIDILDLCIGKNLDSPEHLKLNMDKKETFDIIKNSNSEVKNYILGKIQ